MLNNNSRVNWEERTTLKKNLKIKIKIKIKIIKKGRRREMKQEDS
jgi:hypothetical protein